MMNKLSFIPLGGIGDVTKNMYLYEVGNEILIVDCGLGFADTTMPGVDLLIPDISYLKFTNKKIVGMVLTHGHEDHIGGLPFILPSLPQFPIYGSNLTSALANEKLADVGVDRRVQTVKFNEPVSLGSFSVNFIRLTHSVIDTANLFIKTPAGNIYHGSDFKFDQTPVDGKKADVDAISKAGQSGIICLFQDCLGSERPGFTPSESKIIDSFEEEFRKTRGKIIVTTYSSNISRLNQAIEVGLKLNRKICFIGRSLIKARDIGKSLGYMNYPRVAEIKPQDVKKFDPSKLMLLIAGSQGQESSALVRIASGEDRDIRIEKGDTVIFSSDPIPGNEVSVNSLIDTISKRGARVVYSDITDKFHVSGHGSRKDIELMIKLTHPKFLVPIGGTYRQMVAYREIAKDLHYNDNQVILIDSGQEVVFDKGSYHLDKKIKLSNVFLDQVSGETIESYVVFDRLKIAKEGIVIIIAEIDSNTGQLVSKPDIISRGFIYENKDKFVKLLETRLQKELKGREKVTNWIHYRKLIERTAERILYRERREPLIIPVILEV